MVVNIAHGVTHVRLIAVGCDRSYGTGYLPSFSPRSKPLYPQPPKDKAQEPNRDMASQRPLRVGFVPEHFSTPIHFAKKHYGLDAELTPFPSGTGHMITALRSGEIDAAIGLTEGWVAALGKSQQSGDGDGGYRLVGTYVETPLCEPACSVTWETSL